MFICQDVDQCIYGAFATQDAAQSSWRQTLDNPTFGMAVSNVVGRATRQTVCVDGRFVGFIDEVPVQQEPFCLYRLDTFCSD